MGAVCNSKQEVLAQEPLPVVPVKAEIALRAVLVVPPEEEPVPAQVPAQAPESRSATSALASTDDQEALVQAPATAHVQRKAVPAKASTRPVVHPRRKLEEKKTEQTGTESIPSHAMRETNTHTVHYPDHPPRQDTALYRKTHRQLCIVQDLPCLACGKTRKENHIETETHHFFCEKAGEKAVDWVKFGQFAQNLYNIQTGAHVGSAFDWEKVQKNPDLFVDSIYNMVVLCPECHRSAHKGIHHVPFPEWILQLYAADGFTVLT